MRGLLTQHELVPLVGSDRTARDWQARGLLSRPDRIDGWGQRLRVFPEFALAQLALATRAQRSGPQISEALSKHARALYEAEPYRHCAQLLKRHLQGMSQTNLPAVVGLLEALDAEGLAALQYEIEQVEIHLAEVHGVSLIARVGRLEAVEAEAYVIAVDGEPHRFDRRHVGGELELGGLVRWDRVAIGNITEDYALPATEDSEWRAEAANDIRDAVGAAEGRGDLPSLDYAFVLEHESPRGWESEALRALATASSAEDWERFMARGAAAYIDAHPSLQERGEEPAAAIGVGVGDSLPTGHGRWASFEVADVFGRGRPGR